jgi:glycosyltransferase involved in cell wall biosynthesis
MRIAYATTYDASNIHNWSGSGYYIAKCLEQQNIALDYIGPLKMPLEYPLKAKKWLILKLLRKKFLLDRHPLVLKSYAKQIQRSLASMKVDALFSPGTAPVALLETNKPSFFWTDSTFVTMIDYYAAFSDLSDESVKDGCSMEAEALARCRLAFYSSGWAARTAIDNYPEVKDKVRFVPFGANFENNYSVADIQEIVNQRPTNCCNLLFSGVEWYRKGCDTAVEVATQLRQQGLNVTLSIVGLEPAVPVPDFVKVYGFVSKSNPEGVKTLNRLFRESHFLIVPSRAENYGIVFAESSSFGLPAITRDVGGITSAVRNGLNGHAFAPNAPISEYCSYISDLMQNPARYRDLALSSFNEFQTRLNWRVAGQAVKKMMEEVI